MALPNQLNKNQTLIFFTILLIISFLSRFYGVWLWDLVGDENFTANLAHERFKSFVNPANYALVVAFNYIFGQEDWISRLPALTLSIISIPLLYLTWSKAIGKNAALIAAIILIFSAWHLWYSQFARHYAGVFLFSSIAYYFFYNAIISGRITHLFWALTSSLIAILFHLTAVWVPISCAAAYLAILIVHHGNDKYSQRIIKIYMFVCIIAAIALSPLLYSVLDGWVQIGRSWGYGSILIVPQLIKYIQVPIAVSAFFGWLLLIKKEPVAATFFALTLGVPILFLVISAPYMSISPAYAFYTLSLIIILSGVACEEARKSIAKHSKALSLFPLALLLASLLPAFVSHYLEKTSLNFSSVAQYLEKNYQEGDKLLSFIPGNHSNIETLYQTLPFISSERDTAIDWGKALNPLLSTGYRTLIVTSIKRKPLAPELETWLLCNSKLVWQKHALRIDYEVSGYQIFLVPGNFDKNNTKGVCKTN